MQDFLAFKASNQRKLDEAAALRRKSPTAAVPARRQQEDQIASSVGNPQCTNRSNCFNYSCGFFEYSNDFITILGDKGGHPGFDEFYKSLGTAISIMRKHSGVITDDYYFPHMTIQYMCCYDLLQYEDIIGVINDFKWQPFNLTFDRVVCNNGGDGISEFISFIVLLDQESQDSMFAFVEGVENALKAKGIKIHRPRVQQELFHSTVGVVDGSYPVAQVLQQIKQALPKFNSIPMIADTYWSFFPLNQFKAHS